MIEHKSAKLQVIETWGPNVPDWIERLADCVDNLESRAKAAAHLGLSPSVVSQTLNNVYRGKIDNVEKLVRAKLENGQTQCPLLGEITADLCFEHASRNPKSIHPVHKMMASACAECPINPKGAAA